MQISESSKSLMFYFIQCKLKNLISILIYIYSKICLKRSFKNSQNKSLKDKWKLNEGRKYFRMLSLSILQYFWPALSDNRSWNSILVFFLSEGLRQVLLYILYYRSFDVLFVLLLYIKVNNFLIDRFPVFLGWTSTKQWSDLLRDTTQ